MEAVRENAGYGIVLNARAHQVTATLIARPRD